jgi:DNA-binding transcriptional regulator/RsmH inhibitor MraZ
MLWDKDNKLVMANRRAREIQNKMGIELKPGVSRFDMLEAGLKSGSVLDSEGLSAKEWVKKRKERIINLKGREIVETRIRVDNVEFDILGSFTRLNDGGTLQVWTDISDIRMKEREVQESQNKVREAEEKISNAIDSLNPFEEKKDYFATSILSESINLQFDSEGRISLTSKLLKHAKIKNSMLFVGQGKTFQIWEPTIFEKFRVTARRKSNIHRASLKWERQFNN